MAASSIPNQGPDVGAWAIPNQGPDVGATSIPNQGPDVGFRSKPNQGPVVAARSNPHGSMRRYGRSFFSTGADRPPASRLVLAPLMGSW